MAGHTARRVQRVRGPIVGAARRVRPLGGARGRRAWAKPRPVLVLPYQGAEPDPWFGEAIAETLFVAAQGTPALLPIDRGRAVQVGARGDRGRRRADRSPLALARVVRAEVVFHGEYQRTAGRRDHDHAPAARREDRAEPDARARPRARRTSSSRPRPRSSRSYAKALNLGLKTDEVDRLVAAAKPTTNLTAFEAFAKGRRSALRGTQEGNEGAAELLARAVEVDPTFGLAHYHLGHRAPGAWEPMEGRGAVPGRDPGGHHGSRAVQGAR